MLFVLFYQNMRPHIQKYSMQFILQESKKVVGLDWSHADPDLVLSVTEDAVVACWNLESNTVRRLPALTKISPLCLASNPHNKDIIAVGGKLGYLQIVDIKGLYYIILL